MSCKKKRFHYSNLSLISSSKHERTRLPTLFPLLTSHDDKSYKCQEIALCIVIWSLSSHQVDRSDGNWETMIFLLQKTVPASLTTCSKCLKHSKRSRCLKSLTEVVTLLQVGGRLYFRITETETYSCRNWKCVRKAINDWCDRDAQQHTVYSYSIYMKLI